MGIGARLRRLPLRTPLAWLLAALALAAMLLVSAAPSSALDPNPDTAKTAAQPAADVVL